MTDVNKMTSLGDIVSVLSIQGSNSKLGVMTYKALDHKDNVSVLSIQGSNSKCYSYRSVCSRRKLSVSVLSIQGSNSKFRKKN